jgi:hypothetical protein
MSEPTNRDQLTDQVRGLLGDVLQQADFPGSEELAQQVSSVIVTGGPITMLKLRSAHTLRASAFPDGPIPMSMLVSNSAGDSVGELLVWVEHGFLSGLEFAWWTDDAPDELPSSDRVKVNRK